jgi:RNA polymerase sigma-32 factor
VWWIKAGIQAYIARTWALVRVLPSSQQRRILFGRHRMDADGGREERKSATKRTRPVRKRANRSEFEGWHKAANAARHYMPIDCPVVDEGRLTLTETLASPEPSAERRYGDHELRLAARARIDHVRERLTDAQRRVLDERILAETPATLQELSDALSISRERVRQVELSVKRKLERKLRPVMRAI